MAPEAAKSGNGGGAQRGGSAADAQIHWSDVKKRIRARIGGSSYSSWIEPLKAVALHEDRAVLSASTVFMRDWIRNNYRQLLLQEFRRELPHLRDMVIELDREPDEGGAAAGARTPMPKESLNAAQSAISGAATPLTRPAPNTGPDAGVDGTRTFENFVTGKSNDLAFAAAERVADSKDVGFNPLFLYSGVGLGKTHLMQAVAWRIGQTQPGRNVLCLSAQNFLNGFMQALRQKEMSDFKAMFRSVDVLMIDDLQFLAGKESTQDEFFNIFNDLVDRKRQVMIAADRAPADLVGIEERIRSRLGAGLVADIRPTDFELRVGILEQKAGVYPHIRVPDEVIRFLAHRITTNVRELEGGLKRVIAERELMGQAITLELAQRVLTNLLRAHERKVTIAEIQKKVAEHFGIKIADMSSGHRARVVARPRQVAMYLAKRLTVRSYPEIGRKFGNRDHTTVLYGVRRIEALIAQDQGLAEDVRLLEAALSD